MNFFKGETRILFVKIDDDYVPVGCLTDNSFSESVDMIGTTTQQDNGWKTSRPTTQSFSVDFSGLQVISTNDVKSYDELVTFKRNRQLLDWKITGNSSLKSEVFKGHIVDISESASTSEFVTFDGTIEGFGKPIRTENDVTFTMDSETATFDSETLTMDYNG